MFPGATAARADNYPSRPIRIVVPTQAGAAQDILARLLQPHLEKSLGQPIIVENRSGASTMIGTDAVAKAAPDGYTLLLGANGPILFAPEMASRRAYEWRRDFAPITMVSLTPLVLQVHPSVAARSTKEFIELVRREPGKLTMSSPGPGTTNHLLSELVQSKLGLNWVTVQYKGNAPATTDLIAGHVNFNFDQVSVALPYIKDGRTRALGVTGSQRTAWLPDLPTFEEQGFPDIVGATFTGLMAPAKTPPEIVARLNAEMRRILSDPQIKSRFTALGADAVPMSADEFRRYLEKEDATWLPLIRQIGIKVE